jgi:hypothetical protein
MATQKNDNEPTNAEVLSKLTEVMAALAAKPDSTQGVGEMISQVLQKISEQNARHVLPSNAQNLDGRSFFRPKGWLHPDYADLKWHRQPWHNGHRVTLEEVSPEEIAAFNELSKLLSGPESQRTARSGKWRVWIGRNNGDMYLNVPCKTIEDQAELPATLVFLLREFIDGKAIDPASLYSELAALKAQLEAALKQQQTVTA